ncbi:MAG TPA: hypothetical protein VIN08_14895 [Ohtaekwangia sp.]|uniref:hypothetical protein n=1 Tax=Ohtaekwangia sp. TaxID=2066019 RepID=UPI002F9339CC
MKKNIIGISIDAVIKKLTLQIDALLLSNYSASRESFTCVRNEVELVKRAPWLVVMNK